jgi:hypothetical protein
MKEKIYLLFVLSYNIIKIFKEGLRKNKMKKILIFFGFISFSIFSQTTGIRDLPPKYVPGSSINVVLNINPYNVYAVIVKEKLPPGWQISSSNPSYSKVEFDGSNYTYTWLIINFSKEILQPFSINYTVNVPSGSIGVYEFSGKILVSGSEEIPITGDRYISDSIVIVKGDINKDGSIDISDVILCLRMAIEIDPPDLNLADMNDDESIDILDVILVLRKAIGLQ